MVGCWSVDWGEGFFAGGLRAFRLLMGFLRGLMFWRLLGRGSLWSWMFWGGLSLAFCAISWLGLLCWCRLWVSFIWLPVDRTSSWFWVSPDREWSRSSIPSKAPFPAISAGHSTSCIWQRNQSLPKISKTPTYPAHPNSTCYSGYSSCFLMIFYCWAFCVVKPNLKLFIVIPRYYCFCGGMTFFDNFPSLFIGFCFGSLVSLGTSKCSFC